MHPNSPPLLTDAVKGNINAFQGLFADFHPALKSYLYRLVTDRNDAEDLAHDTFIKAFDKLVTFQGQASLKTWVFQIATNLAYDHLKGRKRWQPDVKAQGKALCMSNTDVYDAIMRVHEASTENAYDLKEHINHCFTCMAKTLPIEQQVALILKDVYNFSIKELALILEKSADVAKHLVQDARHRLMDIFEHRCALINKAGVCHQCSELNGLFNPRQNRQEEFNKLDLVKGSKRFDRAGLLALRTTLVKGIDPLRAPGADLQDILMRCDRLAMGEVTTMS
ncbi:RNA polymerase sigma factor [Hymenobacter terrenus]|uniref:RNA polymerase sigma factor n=1 Tax=Hymenobacter terrenus TaxID=1629124 RepID=UPI000619B9D5|nr:RNA polymerase sigma factor [Hymenobacter terrenus]